MGDLWYDHRSMPQNMWECHRNVLLYPIHDAIQSGLYLSADPIAKSQHAFRNAFTGFFPSPAHRAQILLPRRSAIGLSAKW